MTTMDEHKYDDIIHLVHPVSKKHPQMAPLDRAAQFSPFAALTGHTDAIKENIVPNLSEKQLAFVYANEADVLNMALFGKTAKEWRTENPDKKGNIRDYATIEQLLVIANMESFNAILIEQGVPQRERLIQLNSMAKSQLRVLENQNTLKLLKE